MERQGLVSCIEGELERVIGVGMLPEGGKLASEQTLARRYGVSRTTIREALGRLAARGLVVQRAGRKTRAVPLDETVTLENLGVALHGMGSIHSDRRQLLEGYFALKRETTVELLVACREHASRWELDKLEQACFALWNAARWEEDWVAREFELLRLAARAARRPGHLLLIHSLERAFRGIQARVLPHLDAEAVGQWALRAMHGLAEADPAALKRELPPLLRACDERVLERLAPVREVDDTPRTPGGAAAEVPHLETAPAQEALSGAVFPNRSACRTGSGAAAPEEASLPGPAPADSCSQPGPGLHEARGPLPDATEAHVPTSLREGSPPHAPPGPRQREESPPPATWPASEAPSGTVFREGADDLSVETGSPDAG
jgi:DNA-binding FadR family transcriptional regulator